MMSTDNKPPFRIAFRREGDFVKTYFAEYDTMEGAHLVGMLRVSILDRVPGAFEAWQTILKEAMSAFLQDAFDVELSDDDYRVERAPEHERSGRA